MLRKDLISKNQPAGKDNLGINKEPNPQEAIVYSGGIIRELNVVQVPRKPTMVCMISASPTSGILIIKPPC